MCVCAAVRDDWVLSDDRALQQRWEAEGQSRWLAGDQVTCRWLRDGGWRGLGAEGATVPWSESFLIGRQVLLCSLVRLQGFYSVHVLWQLRLPSHQSLILLYLLRPLGNTRQAKLLT